MGLNLISSLEKHCASFHLWILCMDEKVENNLKIISPKNISLIPLSHFETERMLAVKKERSVGEYCWTLTPFLPQYILDKDHTIPRVTYLDADLFFFDSPQKLLRELEDSKCHVLITEHAYDPKYDQTESSGRFCVQFVTFDQSKESHEILSWWQDRCIEWCFARHEEGKFGDQKYLDQWPELFSGSVKIVSQKEKTLAPWNLKYFLTLHPNLNPVFYHFHGLRILSKKYIRLKRGYTLPVAMPEIYKKYLESMKKTRRLLQQNNIAMPKLELTYSLLAMLKLVRDFLKSEICKF